MIPISYVKYKLSTGNWKNPKLGMQLLARQLPSKHFFGVATLVGHALYRGDGRGVWGGRCFYVATCSQVAAAVASRRSSAMRVAAGTAISSGGAAANASRCVWGDDQVRVTTIDDRPSRQSRRRSLHHDARPQCALPQGRPRHLGRRPHGLRRARRRREDGGRRNDSMTARACFSRGMSWLGGLSWPGRRHDDGGRGDTGVTARR